MKEGIKDPGPLRLGSKSQNVNPERERVKGEGRTVSNGRVGAVISLWRDERETWTEQWWKYTETRTESKGVERGGLVRLF